MRRTNKILGQEICNTDKDACARLNSEACLALGSRLMDLKAKKVDKDALSTPQM